MWEFRGGGTNGVINRKCKGLEPVRSGELYVEALAKMRRSQQGVCPCRLLRISVNKLP